MKESSIILTFLKKIIRKIHTFFRKSLNKELLIFLIFLLISCFFWVLQSLQEIGEVELEIPISYSEVPANISITNKLPRTVKVTLRDKGTNLYYYYRHRKELTLQLNLMNWYRKDGVAKIPASSFDTYFRNHLISTTQLIRIYPGTILVYFVEKASKVVPVHLNSSVTLSAQHILSKEPVLSPAEIIAYAPAEILSKLKQVETELLKLDEISDSIIINLKLKPIDGVRFSTQSIQVKLTVEEFTEQSLMIPVTGLNFSQGEELLSFPPSVKVTFFVGLSSYKKISEKDFVISVDRANLIHSEKKSQKVILTQSPAIVHNLRIQPETVECLIEKK